MVPYRAMSPLAWPRSSETCHTLLAAVAAAVPARHCPLPRGDHLLSRCGVPCTDEDTGCYPSGTIGGDKSVSTCFPCDLPPRISESSARSHTCSFWQRASLCCWHSPCVFVYLCLEYLDDDTRMMVRCSPPGTLSSSCFHFRTVARGGVRTRTILRTESVRCPGPRLAVRPLSAGCLCLV